MDRVNVLLVGAALTHKRIRKSATLHRAVKE